MTDQVFIENLLIDCIIGILPHERLKSQPLIVDVTFELDLTLAAENNDLARSIDYSRAAAMISRTLLERQFELLETAATEIIAELLEWGRNAAVKAVTVSLRKPEALGQGAIAGVRLRRTPFPL